MRFGILGPLQVADDEGHEVVLAAPKQRALLAILLLHANEVVSCDQMVEELWAGAQSGLHSSVALSADGRS